ncbi:ribonuclease HI family protein [candidate division FCPU426 bacterium]|nr:ribonuclease HI family protein [candidate division FCPU426 bacterium]
MMTGYVFCDGGARGNPGPAAAAAVLFDPRQRRLDQTQKYLGITTNNVAEYEGLLLGLGLAQAHGVRNIHLRLDSELVVRQLLGEYKVKHPALRPLWQKAQTLLKAFAGREIRHVPREENSAADRLVNESLDRHVRGGG